MAHHRILQDAEKYSWLLGRLPAEVLINLHEFIATQIPCCAASNTRYEVLKAAVSRAVAPLLRARATTIARELNTSDKAPSQLMNEMRPLAGPRLSNDPLLCKLWLQRPPTMAQAVVMGNLMQTWAEVASLADRIVGCTREANPLVAAYAQASFEATGQAPHAGKRSAPRPILGQQTCGSAAPVDDSANQSSAIQALSSGMGTWTFFPRLLFLHILTTISMHFQPR
ncbi:unnamed protein product [Calicophoron daubneyi]|uniref:Uncharacterized protein n=1 Tax=Calicophoron daubneyi TaxID=300641 RepID=A0AAV2TTS8_CALDB